MFRVLTALRALAYMTAFVYLWGWLALQVRDVGAEWAVRLPASSRAAGAGLMALGGIVVSWCVALFVGRGRGTPAPFDPPRTLVPAGPYRWVRNPMYVGALVVLAGFGLWHASLAMVLFAVPAFVLAHLFVVLYEEPSLARRFGPPYEAYRSQVRRWLPRRPRLSS